MTFKWFVAFIVGGAIVAYSLWRFHALTPMMVAAQSRRKST